MYYSKNRVNQTDRCHFSIMLEMVQGNTVLQYSRSEGTYLQDITKEAMRFVSCAASLYSLQGIIMVGIKWIFIQFLKFNCGLKFITFRKVNGDFRFSTDFTAVLKGFNSLVTGFTSSNYRHLKDRCLNYSVSNPAESNRETSMSRKATVFISECLFLTTKYKRSLGWLAQPYAAKLKPA